MGPHKMTLDKLEKFQSHETLEKWHNRVNRLRAALCLWIGRLNAKVI